MNPDEEIFGFTNRWYKEGVKRAVRLEPPLPSVSIFPFPYFLATKIEAFLGRGNGDYQGSPDMEDIISILEVHPKKNMGTQLKDTSFELRNYLREHLNRLSKDDGFIDALPGPTFNRINSDQGCREVTMSIEILLEYLDMGSTKK